MVSSPESPATPGEALELQPDAGRAVGADPVRRLVHVALALYLTPVIAVVCLIGGVSILVGKATRVAERLATRPGDEGLGSDFRDDRGRTRVGH